MSTDTELSKEEKLIAEFMGLRIDILPDKSDWWFVDLKNIDSIFHNKNESLFSSSWDWLMPVVEKIEKLRNHVFIIGTSCEIKTTPTSILIKDNTEIHRHQKFTVSHDGISKIESTYKSCVEFIQRYNTHQ